MSSRLDPDRACTPQEITCKGSLFPVEGPFFEDIEVGHAKDSDECTHRQEGHRVCQDQFPELHRPWIHEDNFDIKNDEKYGDQLADDAVRNVDWFIFDRTEIPVTWTGVDILDFQSDLRVSKRFVRVFNESGIEAYATPNAVQLAGLEPID